MSTCTSIDPLVTAYVDGELADGDRTLVDAHLRRCAPCYSRVAAEAAVHELMRARKPALCAEHAPAELRARCSGLAARMRSAAGGRLARTRWVPLALAAALVLAVSAAFLYQATEYSARVLAAELAADHMKCFAANRLFGTHDEPAAVESSMLSSFGWTLHLPEQFNAFGFELVGSRQCLYAEGRIAHLMYRDHGRPVSIFMLPRRARAEELVEVLGHRAAIWSVGDRTFVLVTRASPAELERMATFVKAALQ
jgi:anti-sigma factor RsiW